MAPSEAAFDAAAARVVATYRERAANRHAYEQAWTTFYQDHMYAVMNEAKLYAKARKLGFETDDVRNELVIAVLGILAKGNELNRRVIYGVRRNLLGKLGEHCDKLNDEDVRERFAARLADLDDTDAVDVEGMSTELRQLITELEQTPRSQLKVQVLRAMLQDPDWTYASISRGLGRGADGAGVRSTCHYLFEHIRITRPALADYLELPQPGRSAGLGATKHKGSD